ncbi:hypothetical protein KKF60_01490 [Patescibacteria group bacterium]|nr:hypothetical protein [Patescibacteria group bacterium]MBU4458559.1 hypothetical protein [Patescibacteria group bacterium]MCG2696087.1 hypothetical protein [Candidatus Portnoybacteria bacterium]
MAFVIVQAMRPTTQVVIRAVGHGIAVSNDNFNFKSRPPGGFYFSDLFSAFATDSVETSIRTAVTKFNLVAVARRTTTGADKASIREISRSFATKRRYNSSSRQRTHLFFVYGQINPASCDDNGQYYNDKKYFAHIVFIF